MDLQTRSAARALSAMLLTVAAGCTGQRDVTAARYARVAVEESGIAVYESEHVRLFTTLLAQERIGPIMATLEAAFAAYEAVTLVRTPTGAPRMSVYVFQQRDQWEAFTRSRTGSSAALYLQLDRGGYAFADFAALRDQGTRDTLTVLAHEGFHVYVSTHWQARPPPFIEEGLATLFESVRQGEQGGVRIDLRSNASRLARLAALREGNGFQPLRRLLSMHAGNVVGLTGPEVDAFYAQAWAFVRFLREGEEGRHHEAFRRLLKDAATGALSSSDLAGNAAMVERYLGTSLETLDPAYRQFAKDLAAEAARSVE